MREMIRAFFKRLMCPDHLWYHERNIYGDEQGSCRKCANDDCDQVVDSTTTYCSTSCKFEDLNCESEDNDD